MGLLNIHPDHQLQCMTKLKNELVPRFFRKGSDLKKIYIDLNDIIWSSDCKKRTLMYTKVHDKRVVM